MCGICGELRVGAAANIGAVARMGETMSDRGPDGEGVWAQGPVALAHRRLKIIDLSECAAQPMTDPELGLTIVFNGCIYNYPELREELSGDGYRFFSTSDTEVLLKAYHRWGEDFVEHLLGMFAFCIVERDSGRAILGRDRLGIKPLYLADVRGALRFASTLPALLAGGGIDTSIDPVALHHYMMFHAVVPAPYTILCGVRRLAPATLLVVESDGTRRTKEYWSPSFVRDPAHDGMSPEDWQDAVLSTLRTAVERRMVADVPVGVLLSGGLDSSVIVGLLAELGQKHLQTFSVGFEEDGAHLLHPGDAACWPAGAANAHQVVNRSGAPCTYLIFGTRMAHDIVHYPDVRRILYDEGGTWRLHRTDDGSLIKGGKIEQVRPLTRWGAKSDQVP
jgi:asparagine synthase (glutamine-hydrolysing)